LFDQRRPLGGNHQILGRKSQDGLTAPLYSVANSLEDEKMLRIAASSMFQRLMRVGDSYPKVVNKKSITSKDQSTSPADPGTSDTKKHDSSARVKNKFRQLTEKEKEEFVNSLDAKGKQIYAELAGE